MSSWTQRSESALVAIKRAKGLRLTRPERLEIRRCIAAGESVLQAAQAARCTTRTVQRLLNAVGGVHHLRPEAKQHVIMGRVPLLWFGWVGPRTCCGTATPRSSRGPGRLRLCVHAGSECRHNSEIGHSRQPAGPAASGGAPRWCRAATPPRPGQLSGQLPCPLQPTRSWSRPQ